MPYALLRTCPKIPHHVSLQGKLNKRETRRLIAKKNNGFAFFAAAVTPQQPEGSSHLSLSRLFQVRASLTLSPMLRKRPSLFLPCYGEERGTQKAPSALFAQGLGEIDLPAEQSAYFSERHLYMKSMALSRVLHLIDWQPYGKY